MPWILTGLKVRFGVDGTNVALKCEKNPRIPSQRYEYPDVVLVKSSHPNVLADALTRVLL
jgi:hypothetical protein